MIEKHYWKIKQAALDIDYVLFPNITVSKKYNPIMTQAKESLRKTVPPN